VKSEQAGRAQAPVAIRDLIDVPPVKTVIQLVDLVDPDQRGRLADSFVLTDEVRAHLRRFLVALNARTGFAAFLRGHFGTGKSHFLAFLDLLLSGEVSSARLSVGDTDLEHLVEAGVAQRCLVVPISLVEHSATESLERVVSDALARATGPVSPALDPGQLGRHIDTFRYHLRQHYRDILDIYLLEHGLTEEALFSPDKLHRLDELAQEVGYAFRPEPGRVERFEHLFAYAEQEGRQAVVLLLDELSEFLHARTGPALTEDVRFLQYLGETTAERPLYVVAALQEYLEAAEYGLPGEVVRKIKDRYPHNLELTSSHIEEIVATRLIRRRPGADEVIARVHAGLRLALQGFPVSFPRFARTYPVHPATTLLLDRLKPLLSRGRGIIDFIHYRLRGSESRGIPPHLDAPVDELITPDMIFDHFRVRFRENIEIAEYETLVYAWYERHLPEIFPDPDRRNLADRVVKLLILLAISPEPRPYSVRTVAQALLVRVSRLDPDANVRIVQEVLQTLESRGAYVERMPALEDGRPDFDDVYRISLKADLNVLVGRRIQAMVTSLEGAPALRIYEALAPELELESLPFSHLLGRGPQPYVIQWQRTPREGLVYLGGLTDIDVATLTQTVARLRDEELDWVLFIGVPYEVEQQRVHLDEVLLPALRRVQDPCARTVLFWLPTPVGFDGEDGAFLRETLARKAVLDQARTLAGTSRADAMAALLTAELANARPRVEGIFHRAYYQGRVSSVTGDEEDVSGLGRPRFEQTLLALFTPVLADRFPDHNLCAPLGRPPTMDDVQAIVENLFRTGVYQPRKGDPDLLANRIVSLLRPLGLVKKAGNSLTLAPDSSRSGVAKAFLEMVGEDPRPIAEVQRALRKGTFGLIPTMFQLLTLGLAYAGAITCYARGARKDPGQLSALNFAAIDSVSQGDLGRIDLSPLEGLPFLENLPTLRGNTTPQRLAKVWESIHKARGALIHVARQVRQGIEQAPDRYRDRLHVEALADYCQVLETLASAVRPDLPAHQGVEAFLHAVRSQPVCGDVYRRLKDVAQFLQDGMRRLLAIEQYLEAIGPLPDGLEFASLDRRRADVLTLLNDADITADGATRVARVEHAFRQFQAEYVEVYARRHETNRGPSRFKSHAALQDDPRYRLLERLSTLTSLAVDDWKGAIDRRIHSALEKQCLEFDPGRLLSIPTCTCGFRIQDQVTVEPLHRLHAALSEAVAQYLSALQTPEHREHLAHAARELQTTDHSQAGSIQRFLDLIDQPLPSSRLLTPADCSPWLELLTPELLQTIAQALRGTSHIQERNLAVLVARLQDRCLARADAAAELQRFLEEDAPGPGVTHYRFVFRDNQDAPGSTAHHTPSQSRNPEPEPAAGPQPLTKGSGTRGTTSE